MTNAHPLMVCKFDAIYNVGDSKSDTNNLVLENSALPFARLPYGETFFKNATGRCSNGLLMIDNIVLVVGAPFLYPNLKKDVLFLPRLGENFVVVGSTSLSTNTLQKKNILFPVTNSSLDVQLDWMSSHFNAACLNDQNCVKKCNKALFMVREIEGNDYYYAFFQGKPVEEIKAMVP
ncbi:acetylajmalan esterase-like [Juglans regia]|uniref:Acetylajmalan esterase-like n=1 Tax=Juglans regia TaxID=51240 RepID=A0A6P9EVP4_JUGRE|nr:acetylajmalan esterase-like [Juglans regia]